MEALTNDHIIGLLGIIGNILLILIAGLITYFTVNKYQKDKEKRELKENVIRDLEEYLIELNKLESLVFYLKDKVSPEKLHDLVIQRGVVTAKTTFLIGKITVYYKLSQEIDKGLNDLANVLEERVEALHAYLNSRNFEKRFEFLSKEIKDVLTVLLDNILFLELK